MKAACQSMWNAGSVCGWMNALLKEFPLIEAGDRQQSKEYLLSLPLFDNPKVAS